MRGVVFYSTPLDPIVLIARGSVSSPPFSPIQVLCQMCHAYLCFVVDRSCNINDVRIFLWSNMHFMFTESSGQSLPCASNGQPCSDQLCPNTAVQLTCNIPSNTGLMGTTRWMTSSPNCTLDLDQSGVAVCSGQPSSSPSCPPFTAVNAVTGLNLPCSTSTLTFLMSPNLNGTLITCATTTVAGIIGSITLNSVGKYKFHTELFYRMRT